MKTINQRVDEDFLFGCIKYYDVYSIYLMPIAYWILNYSKYDPNYNANDWKFVFRDNILNVTDEETINFLKSIEGDKITREELNDIKIKVANGEVIIHFFVDFDRKIMISSFPDIEVEAYLPSDAWKGMFDNPLKYTKECLLKSTG